MGAYERAHLRPTADAKERHRVALKRFLAALVSGDVPAVEAMLADSVVHLSDGGGEYYAAKVPVLGRKRVAAFILRLIELRGPVDRAELRDLNALPALNAAYAYAKPRAAPRFTLQIQLDTEGKISAIYLVLRTGKLTQLLHPTGPAHSVGRMAPEK
jgi:RNA polymerase sigma-70 factor (ECF subfamily)